LARFDRVRVVAPVFPVRFVAMVFLMNYRVVGGGPTIIETRPLHQRSKVV
jgi:hypothetical protein